MLLFFVIVFLIVISFYFYISKDNVKEEYKLKDIANGTITRIRGSYIDITCDGETVRIIKKDGDGWYYKKADDQKNIEYDFIFKVGDREFEITKTKKRDGSFILIPLFITVITIAILFFQTSALIKENEEKGKVEENNIDAAITTPIDLDVTTINDEPSSPMEEDRAERYINKSSKIKAFRSSVTARLAVHGMAGIYKQN